jgi:hypothetical protein
MRLKVEMEVAGEKGQKLLSEDGELVEGVKSITWSANAVERPTLTVEFFPKKLDFDLGSTPLEPAEEPEPE